MREPRGAGAPGPRSCGAAPAAQRDPEARRAARSPPSPPSPPPLLPSTLPPASHRPLSRRSATGTGRLQRHMACDRRRAGNCCHLSRRPARGRGTRPRPHWPARAATPPPIGWRGTGRGCGPRTALRTRWAGPRGPAVGGAERTRGRGAAQGRCGRRPQLGGRGGATGGLGLGAASAVGPRLGVGVGLPGGRCAPASLMLTRPSVGSRIEVRVKGVQLEAPGRCLSPAGWPRA